MATKNKKVKKKQKSKSEAENDDCIKDPQSSKIVQRMASKTLSSSARKLRHQDDNVNDSRLQAEKCQSSLWMSKTKVYEDLYIRWLLIVTFHSNCGNCVDH